MTPTLEHLLRPISHWLADADVEEIIINEPGRAWIWSGGRFTSHTVALDAEEITDIGIVAGASRRQDFADGKPLLSTDLQGAGRLQIVLPPCVDDGKPSLTIRRGNSFSPTLDFLSGAGLFVSTGHSRPVATEADADLLKLYDAGDWSAFFSDAVRAKKTMLTCGETASGKTTLAKAFINEMPLHERLITIEDTPEWTNLPHENRVALYYDKNGSAGSVRASDLVEAALRMRIGRLLVQELRDGPSCVAFLRALASGHTGGLSTVHAPHAEGALDAIRLMLKETPSGAAQSDTDIMLMLRTRIDVIVHCNRDLITGKFGLSQVWFAPAVEREARHAAH